MNLMPAYDTLTTEHIKSHLQKYRIHNERSKTEFLDYYNKYFRSSFHEFEKERGWEQLPLKKGISNKLQQDEIDAKLISDAEKLLNKWSTMFEDVVIAHNRVRDELRSHIGPTLTESERKAAEVKLSINILPTKSSYYNLFYFI